MEYKNFLANGAGADRDSLLYNSVENGFEKLSKNILSFRGYGLCPEDVRGIVNLVSRRANEVSANFAKHRWHFSRNRNAAEKLKIFSLGTNCYSRSITVRWGFKPYAEEGERSHPFDLAVHGLSTMANSISNNFKSYVDEDSIVWREGKKFPENVKLGISFNHDNSPEFKVDNFIKLRERYSKRISNFYEDLTECKTALFVCTIWIDSIKSNPRDIKDKLERLHFEASQIKNKSHFIFLVISNDSIGEKIRNCIPALKLENSYFILEKTPFQNYSAFNDYHIQQGFDMEARLSNKLYRCILDISSHVEI